MKKEIIFPCGDKLVATSDYGHAYGLVIAHEPVDGNGDEKFIDQCKGCTKCDKIVYIRNYRKRLPAKKRITRIPSALVTHRPIWTTKTAPQRPGMVNNSRL